MSEDGPAPAPRGWYVDPDGSPGWRYFDGTAWTSEVQQSVRNDDALRLRDQVAPLASRLESYALPASAALGGASAFLQYSSRVLLDSGHALYLWLRAGAPNDVVPTLETSPHGIGGVISQLSTLAGIVALVMLLVWQSRSITEASGLGLPQRFGRVFAVWSWFIPFVNVYVPFKSLADLLPPDHPKRRIAWQLCALVPARIVSVVLLVVAIITGSVGWWTIAMAMTFAISVLQPLLRRQLVVAIEVERRAFVALVA